MSACSGADNSYLRQIVRGSAKDGFIGRYWYLLLLLLSDSTVADSRI
jgi:hypothetical protein